MGEVRVRSKCGICMEVTIGGIGDGVAVAGEIVGSGGGLV